MFTFAIVSGYLIFRLVEEVKRRVMSESSSEASHAGGRLVPSKRHFV